VLVYGFVIRNDERLAKRQAGEVHINFWWKAVQSSRVHQTEGVLPEWVIRKTFSSLLLSELHSAEKENRMSHNS